MKWMWAGCLSMMLGWAAHAEVPADWAYTRVLAGSIGEYAVIARRDRNSDDSYIGAGTDEDASQIDIPRARSLV